MKKLLLQGGTSEKGLLKISKYIFVILIILLTEVFVKSIEVVL